ncbi:tail protein X [Afifella marina]|uniref:P2-like prophage tail protein X n=1 Tax=Afifella marina DSM 2698 TaxID=1120955 RepID=A0A1G5MFC1_AFIMA|nr:tail protein X [Afifella marina]MBK1625204.1 hypothetical protein [Afifella marina DSM 2698]MBK1628921.1 hypothetical protein [Afifella marina]MBK5918300.1 hypothetical protein [Afifella marina]RAI22819.1 hypothetical protein CH311_03980 [Afifella marina DSM 2698]SCZ23887.1 P2-like prophage tail protein X [Afifella marina DSM 2698]
MKTVYTVSEDERLDRLAKAIYGTEQGGTVEALLNANPGLAAKGMIVPAGTELVIPEQVAAEEPALVRPWD